MAESGLHKINKVGAVNPVAKAAVVKALVRKKAGPLLQRMSHLVQVEETSSVLASRLVAIDSDWERAAITAAQLSLVVDIGITAETIKDVFAAAGPQLASLTVMAGGMALLADMYLEETTLKATDFLANVAATTRLSLLFAERLGLPYVKIADAALLHDIGFLVMAYDNPKGYSVLPEQIAGSFEPLPYHEVLMSGTHHAEVGNVLLTALGFPKDMCDCAALHHATFDEVSESTQIVRFADSMARQFGCSMGLGNADITPVSNIPGLEVNDELIGLASAEVSKAVAQANLFYQKNRQNSAA